MKIYGLLVFFFGISAIQGLENFQLDLIFKFDGTNDVNSICQNNSIWYNRSTAESHVQRFLQAIFNNSAANVGVNNVAYQTEPGSWDINCANTSMRNVTNVAVLKLNLTTSLSYGKEDVKSRLDNFWHAGWNYSLVSSIVGNKSHWIACGQAKDTENTTKEPGRLHPLDCEKLSTSTVYTPNKSETSTISHSLSIKSSQSIGQYNPSTATYVYSSQTGLSTSTRGSSSQHNLSTSGNTSLNHYTSSTVSDGPLSSDSQSSSDRVDHSSQSQDGSNTNGYTSSKQISSSTDHQNTQSLVSSTGSISSKQDSSSIVHYSSQTQGSSGGPEYVSLKQVSEQTKKDDPSNALAVGLGTGLGSLALLVTLATLLYRYFSEKNKVSDFSGIYGFPPETPRQSDRTGKSTFRQNMA